VRHQTKNLLTERMISSKDIFLDKELKTGGFYELAIQVCPSADNEPIKLYTDYIWKLNDVEGPFDFDFNLIPVDVSNIRHNGILHLDNYRIPFMTYNIREDEPIETGYNWFDICFYTSAIEQIFGTEYETWTENPKSPEQLDNFIRSVLRKLFDIFHFKLAIVGFEVSGQYYFDNFKHDMKYDWTHTKFFISKKDYDLIADENKKLITIIEEY
jgi:hypothetical protein